MAELAAWNTRVGLIDPLALTSELTPTEPFRRRWASMGNA